jgi:hypothetical protein
MKHKWHKEIKAWADGAEIECFLDSSSGWCDVTEAPCFYEDKEYRIKPQPKEPQYLYVYQKKGTGLELGFAPHEGTNMWETKIIGKIKLEVDDE